MVRREMACSGQRQMLAQLQQKCILISLSESTTPLSGENVGKQVPFPRSWYSAFLAFVSIDECQRWASAQKGIMPSFFWSFSSCSTSFDTLLIATSILNRICLSSFASWLA